MRNNYPSFSSIKKEMRSYRSKWFTKRRITKLKVLQNSCTVSSYIARCPFFWLFLLYTLCACTSFWIQRIRFSSSTQPREPIFALFFLSLKTMNYVNWRRKTPLRFPFACNTPTGYLMCIASEVGSLFTVGEMFTITLVLMSGLCMYATSFVSDIEESLQSVNDDLIAARMENQTPKERIKIKNKFRNVIHFYSTVRALSIIFISLFFLSNWWHF